MQVRAISGKPLQSLYTGAYDISMIDFRYNRVWIKNGFAPWRSWLADARLLWWFLGVVVIASVIADWFACGSPRVERLPVAGWGLEIAGVIVVALGLSRKIDLYGGEGFGSRIRAWLLRFPMLRQDKVIPISAAGEINLAGATVNARGEVTLPDDASIEQRVERLESLMRNVPDQIASLRQHLEEVDANDKAELLGKIDDIGDKLDEVKSTNVKANTEDVGWEIVGIGWVIAGLTLATVPEYVLMPSVEYLIGLFTIPVSCSL